MYKMFLLFCLYLPFQIALNPAQGVDLASGRVFILALALLWLVAGLKNRHIFVPAKTQTWLILSFLFLSGFSLFWAENLDWGIRKFLFLLSIFPIYFVAASLITKIIPSESEEAEKTASDPLASLPAGGSTADDSFNKIKIIKFITWGAGLAATVGIIQFLLQFVIGLSADAALWKSYITPLFLGQAFSQIVLEYPSWLVSIKGHDYLRAFSVFPDPHMFSFYLGLVLPLAIGLYGALKKKTYLALATIILLADLLTFSRGGYVGLIAGIIFVAFYFVFANKNSYKKILTPVVAIIVLVIFVVISPVGQRFISSFNAEEGSNKGRFENWTQAVGIIENYPQGAGIGNYSYKIEPSADYRKPIYAHNLYLDIAAETGIINTIIFVFLILFAIKSFTKKAKDNILWLGGAVGIIIFSTHSIFDTPLYSVQVLPLLLIIISLSVINEKKFN
jgi:O-antigen ligase